MFFLDPNLPPFNMINGNQCIYEVACQRGNGAGIVSGGRIFITSC